GSAGAPGSSAICSGAGPPGPGSPREKMTAATIKAAAAGMRHLDGFTGRLLHFWTGPAPAGGRRSGGRTEGATLLLRVPEPARCQTPPVFTSPPPGQALSRAIFL